MSDATSSMLAGINRALKRTETTEQKIAELFSEVRATRAMAQANLYVLYHALGATPNPIAWPALELLPAFDAANPPAHPAASMSPDASPEIPSTDSENLGSAVC